MSENRTLQQQSATASSESLIMRVLIVFGGTMDVSMSLFFVVPHLTTAGIEATPITVSYTIRVVLIALATMFALLRINRALRIISLVGLAYAVVNAVWHIGMELAPTVIMTNVILMLWCVGCFFFSHWKYR